MTGHDEVGSGPGGTSGTSETTDVPDYVPGVLADGWAYTKGSAPWVKPLSIIVATIGAIMLSLYEGLADLIAAGAEATVINPLQAIQGWLESLLALMFAGNRDVDLGADDLASNLGEGGLISELDSGATDAVAFIDGSGIAGVVLSLVIVVLSAYLANEVIDRAL